MRRTLVAIFLVFVAIPNVLFRPALYTHPAGVGGADARRQRRVEAGEPFVYELTNMASRVATWTEGSSKRFQKEGADLDPFGCVMWPGAAELASLIGSEHIPVRGCSFIELGAGTGLCSLKAAKCGAHGVLATDANPLPLELVAEAAREQDLDVTTCVFDLCGDDKLPLGDSALHTRSRHRFFVAADVCYNSRIALALARRCKEAVSLRTTVVVADSVNIARKEFEAELEDLHVQYEKRFVERVFMGHAVAIDEDVQQTANVAIYTMGRFGEHRL